jgi:hypothetical protein
LLENIVDELGASVPDDAIAEANFELCVRARVELQFMTRLIRVDQFEKCERHRSFDYRGGAAGSAPPGAP